LAFLSHWYRKKRLQMHILTGIVSYRCLQNSPLESSRVVVALIENYSTSKPLKVSPEKSQILNCYTVVANERCSCTFMSTFEMWTHGRNFGTVHDERISPGFLGAIANLRNAAISFTMSVLPSALSDADGVLVCCCHRIQIDSME
jgi:hypothetical protein